LAQIDRYSDRTTKQEHRQIKKERHAAIIDKAFEVTATARLVLDRQMDLVRKS